MTVYDVALANYQEFFSHRMAELCGQHNLSFFLVEPLWLREFLDKVQQGDVSVGVLIDMASDPYDNTDLYYRLAREVKASDGHVIDDPDRSPLTTHKGKFHEVLLREGVPETVIVRREDLPLFRVDDALRLRPRRRPPHRGCPRPAPARPLHPRHARHRHLAGGIARPLRRLRQRLQGPLAR